MNAFDSFIRFFPVNDTGVYPIDTALPEGRYPKLPAVRGDNFRFLVPVSDCWKIPVQQLAIGIRPTGTTGVGTKCGTIRKQFGETYTEIRIRVEEAPTADTWRQFALMIGDKNVMGTFKGQQTNLDDYVHAIEQFYAAFPFALVDVDRIGQDIRIRFYPNDRIRLHGETVRIGIGTVKERNLNSPSLLAQASMGVSLGAEDDYTLSVSADIQKGNIFYLDTVSYTATGTEKPADILSALSVASGTFSRTGGATVIAYAQPGTQVVANANRPTLQLLYSSTSGGNDLYTAVVSTDVQPGNVYQVAATGFTTKTVKAVTGSTKASIEALFNTTGGFFALPAGSVPTISVLVGTQTLANSNSPAIQLTKTASLPARTVDRYRVYVGTSILQGNSYELTIGSTTVKATATADDTALTIAQALGYSTNPFTVDVAVGTRVLALARKGPRYHEDTNLAGITLLSVRTFHDLPRVADVTFTAALNIAEYQLTLYSGTTLIAVSNYIQIRPDSSRTAMLRFGPDQVGSVFGTTYAEDGLMQQFRMWLAVDSARLQQNESLYTTLDNRTVRGRTTAWRVHELTTHMEPEAFHRNLWFALKHPVLYLDSKAYRCEGEYTESEFEGRIRYRQGKAQLTELEGFDYRPTFDPITDSMSGNYVVIDSVNRLDGLWIVVKRLSFVETITQGATLASAEYDLFIRTGAEQLRVTISHESRRAYTLMCFPNRLNHFRNIRLEKGRISLFGELETVTIAGTATDLYNPQTATVSVVMSELEKRHGDFALDYSNDYLKYL